MVFSTQIQQPDNHFATTMDDTISSLPTALSAIEKDTLALGFSMGSDHKTGALLRTLVASKKACSVLDLGTGTGLSACWLLDGMDNESNLITIDVNSEVIQIAKKHLGQDRRITFHCQDGTAFLKSRKADEFDLIFADAWPGKFTDLDLALNLLKQGGIYIIDDLLAQPSWPKNHQPSVDKLIDALENKTGFQVSKLNWSSGLILMTKT